MGTGVNNILESGRLCWTMPFSESGAAITTWVSLGLLTYVNNSKIGAKNIIAQIDNAESPSIIPYNANIATWVIKYKSKTIPSILHMTLQVVDLLAKANPFGGGVKGATTACIVSAEWMN